MITLSLSKNKKYISINAPKNDLDYIRNYFSVKNPAFKSRLPFIPSRIYAITPAGKFDIGLYSLVKDFVLSKKIPLEEDKSLIDFLSINKNKNLQTEELNTSLRFYQKNAIEKAIENGSGIIVLPTAAGKTLTAATLIHNLTKILNKKDIKILVLVPSIQLVEQTSADFENFGLNKISKWSGSTELDKNSSIVVAGTQKLLSEKTDKNFLSEIDIFILDEAHILRRGNQLNKIFNFIQTPYKFGFTGTMPPNLIDQWNVIGKLGPVLYEEKTIDLKNQNYIAEFKIKILKINHQNFNFNKTSDLATDLYNQEINFLIENERRNLIIANLALKIAHNTIIMVDRIIHGELLLNILNKINANKTKNVYFIQGSTEIEEREEIRKLMEKNNSNIVIAISKIFSTGINIPSIQNIIFALTGKAKIKIMQSIGRALRLHPLKKCATIFDVADNLKYSKIHLQERKLLYNTENYFYEEKEI